MRLTVEREHTLKELHSTACMCLRSHAHAPVPMSFCFGEIDEFESAMITGQPPVFYVVVGGMCTMLYTE